MCGALSRVWAECVGREGEKGERVDFAYKLSRKNENPRSNFVGLTEDPSSRNTSSMPDSWINSACLYVSSENVSMTVEEQPRINFRACQHRANK